MTFQPADLRAVAANLADKVSSSMNTNHAGPIYGEDGLINHTQITSIADDEAILYMVYERRLLLGYQHIINTLMHILCSDPVHQDISDLRSFNDELKICIDIFLRYTAKNVSEIRELQSLQWMLDAIIDNNTPENLSSFHRIGRSFASMLESCLGSLVSTFTGNRLEFVSTLWGHPWSKT